MKKLIPVIIAAVMLTGCAQVPKNIKDKQERLDNKDSTQAESTVSSETSAAPKESVNGDYPRGDLDYIRSQLEGDLSKKYGTLTVKRADVGNAKTMPTYKVEAAGASQCDYKRMAANAWGEDYESKNKCEYEHITADPVPDKAVPNNDPNAKLYSGDEQLMFEPGNYYGYTSVWLNFGQMGQKTPDDFRSLHVFTNGMVNAVYATQKECDTFYEKYDDKNNSVRAYYPSYDDMGEDSYKMTDGQEWKVADAVKFVQDFADKNLSLNDPVKYTYRVYRLDVMKCREDVYRYSFWLSFCDDGGSLYESDYYGDFAIEDAHIYHNERFFITPHVDIQCIAKDKVFSLRRDFSYKPTEKTQDNETLLTLGGAMAVLQSRLAKNINLDFDTAELAYVVTCDSYPKESYGRLVKYSRDICFKTCDIAMRPYWCFKVGNYGLNYWNMGAYYYVDAVTGDMHMVISPNGA